MRCGAALLQMESTELSLRGVDLGNRITDATDRVVRDGGDPSPRGINVELPTRTVHRITMNDDARGRGGDAATAAAGRGGSDGGHAAAAAPTETRPPAGPYDEHPQWLRQLQEIRSFLKWSLATKSTLHCLWAAFMYNKVARRNYVRDHECVLVTNCYSWPYVFAPLIISRGLGCLFALCQMYATGWVRRQPGEPVSRKQDGPVPSTCLFVEGIGTVATLWLLARGRVLALRRPRRVAAPPRRGYGDETRRGADAAATPTWPRRRRRRDAAATPPP